MTVPSTTRRAGPFTGTGALVAYPFTFKVFAKQDLAVTIADSNGLETDLVLDSSFTVTLNVDQEATPGGTVNYAVGGVATALPTGYTLVVTGDGLEFEQTADLPQGGNFSPVVIENALDRIVMLLQRLWDGVRRSMRLPDTASDSVSTVLPAPTANNFIGWDQAGTALQNVDPNTLATVVAFAAWQSQAFSGDGVTTQFTLSSNPGNVNNLDVIVGAVPQRNNVDFTLSGVVLTFDVAPANGISIFVRWGQALPEGTSTLQARLASGASAADNAGLVAFNGALNYSAQLDDTVGGMLYTAFGRTAREISAGVTPTNYAYAVGDIRRYGAVIGVDNTAAIEAADLVACSGTITLYGNTVGAEGFVYFPPGRWRATNLTYRGAPWVGAGVHVTFIDFYASTGNCINAVGTAGARKQLNIVGITLNGSNCTGTSAVGLRLGYNQRSLEALRRVRIESFPGPGIYFAAPCWMMSFHDVYVYGCATDAASAGTGIGIDPALGALQLLAFDWYNLWLEDNGFAGSAVGGGMDISTNAVDSWNFHGGTWEGNYGLAEVRFKDCINISFVGTPYIEAFAARVVHGCIFDSVFGDAGNLRVTGEVGMTGNGIWAKGTSSVNVDKAYSNIRWVNDLRVEDTASVYLGEAAFLNISVGAGARVIRKMPKAVTLSHALTIAVNAALGTDFTVTIFDNDTMGAPTNPSIGQRIKFTIIQESTVGGFTMSWNAVYKVSWSNTGNTVNKRSSIEFQYDGTNWNQCSAQAPYA